MSYYSPKERSTAVRLGAEYLIFRRMRTYSTLGSIDSQVSRGLEWPRSSKRGVESRFRFLDVDHLRGLGATHIGVLRGPARTGVFGLEVFGNI